MSSDYPPTPKAPWNVEDDEDVLMTPIPKHHAPLRTTPLRTPRTPLRTTPLRTPYGNPTPQRSRSTRSPTQAERHVHVHHMTDGVMKLLSEAQFSYMTPILSTEMQYGTRFQPRSKAYGTAISIDNDHLLHWMRAGADVSSGANGSTFIAHFSNVPHEEFLIKTVRRNTRCEEGPLKDPYACNDPLSMEFVNTVVMASMRSLGMPNFARTYGYFWSRRHVTGHGTNPDTLEYKPESAPAPFMVLEYLRPEYTTQMYYMSVHMESDRKLWWIIVQLLLALDAAQTFNQFTHHDLHLNNIMCVDITMFEVSRGLEEGSLPRTLTYGEHTIPVEFYGVIIDLGRAYVNNRRDVGRALGMQSSDYEPDDNLFWQRHNLSGAGRHYSKCLDMRRMMHGVFKTREFRDRVSLELKRDFLREYPLDDRDDYLNCTAGRTFTGPKVWAENIMQKLARP